MAVNLKTPTRSTVRGWGPTVTLQLRQRARELLDMTTAELNSADFTKLKEAIQNFEELREGARKINLTPQGYER